MYVKTSLCIILDRINHYLKIDVGFLGFGVLLGYVKLFCLILERGKTEPSRQHVKTETVCTGNVA